jgi:hypothetical protein
MLGLLACPERVPSLQLRVVYGAEAMLPLEVAKGSLRVIIYDEGVQDQPSMMTLIW